MTELYRVELKYQYMGKLCIWILKFDNVYSDYIFFKSIYFPVNVFIARYVHITVDLYNFLVNNNICESLKIRHCKEKTHTLCDLKLTTTTLLTMI